MRREKHRASKKMHVFFFRKPSKRKTKAKLKKPAKSKMYPTRGYRDRATPIDEALEIVVACPTPIVISVDVVPPKTKLNPLQTTTEPLKGP